MKQDTVALFGTLLVPLAVSAMAISVVDPIIAVVMRVDSTPHPSLR